MAGTTQVSQQELKELLLRHGLELNGSIGNDFVWEPPVKIFRSARLIKVELGAYSYISPNSEIHRTTIGRYCSIGDNVNIRGSAHPKAWLSSHPFSYKNIFPHSRSYRPSFTFNGYSERTFIGHDVWIGSRAIILPGVRIGNGAIIGAGAVVAKNVPDYAVAVGNPARVVKYRFEQDLIERLLEAQWWNYDLPKALEQNIPLSLDKPSEMLDELALDDGKIPPIEPIRKRYTIQGDKVEVQTLRKASPREVVASAGSDA